MKIGFFDSGFGGLDVMSHVAQKLPLYDYVYLGDNARVPYGDKSQEVIYQYTMEAMQFLCEQDCALIIVACNTASARALRKIQQQWLPDNYPERKILGVIIPSAEEAANTSSGNKIGVIATESTVRSETFEEELHKINKDIVVYQQACPLFVPLIENGERDQHVWSTYISRYLSSLLSDVDTIILGCTHYGIIRNRIQDFLDQNQSSIALVHQGGVVADKTANYLERHPEIESLLSQNNSQDFFVTDDAEKFHLLAKQYFDLNITPVHISL